MLEKGDEWSVLQLLERLARADTVSGLIEELLEGLLSLIPCVSASWNELDLAASIARAVIRPDPGLAWYEAQQPRFSALMLQNPLLAHFERTGDTRPARWTDVDPEGTFRASELFNEFYAPLGIESQLGVILPSPPGTLIGVAINGGASGFSLRDRHILGLLRPHLVSAHRRVRDRAEVGLLRTATTALGWRVALVDWSGRVLDVSGAATGWLAPGEELPVALQDALLEAQTIARDGGPATFGRARALELDGVPHRVWVVASELGPHVVLLRPAPDGSPDALRKAGLSPREVDVALALLDGGSNQELGDRLGVAAGTIRKHLERVYAALGVSDRVSAAAAVRKLHLSGLDRDEP